MESFEKPVIIAICGKSCSGKTTLAKLLTESMQQEYGDDALINQVVSYTTRPPRPGEEEGKDYYFTTTDEFLEYSLDKDILDYTWFRGWHYCHRKSSLVNGYNIAIFDAKGMRRLSHYQDEYNVIAVYLRQKTLVRLKRAYQREGRLRPEFFRRLFTDWRDFRDIQTLLPRCFSKVYEFDDAMDGVEYLTEHLPYKLKNWNEREHKLFFTK